MTRGLDRVPPITTLALPARSWKAEELEARLYKLLVYEKGGFFLSCRDNDEHDRMVASMIVVVPNRVEGLADCSQTPENSLIPARTHSTQTALTPRLFWGSLSMCT